MAMSLSHLVGEHAHQTDAAKQLPLGWCQATSHLARIRQQTAGTASERVPCHTRALASAPLHPGGMAAQ